MHRHLRRRWPTLLDACVDTTDCPHFGLLLGQQGGIECLGLVGTLAQHSPTLKEALRNIVMHLHLHDRGAVPTLNVTFKPGPPEMTEEQMKRVAEMSARGRD